MRNWRGFERFFAHIFGSFVFQIDGLVRYVVRGSGLPPGGGRARSFVGIAFSSIDLHCD